MEDNSDANTSDSSDEEIVELKVKSLIRRPDFNDNYKRKVPQRADGRDFFKSFVEEAQTNSQVTKTETRKVPVMPATPISRVAAIKQDEKVVHLRRSPRRLVKK